MTAAVRSGERSPVDVVEETIEHCEAANAALGAFVLLGPGTALSEARRRARELAAGSPPRPLDGVPFAVKDLIDVAGWPTRGQSRALAGRPARRDADVVTQLRRAGAIPIGKLALEELGIGADDDPSPWPPARNPWALDRTPGGSSSGAGAAVAAGLVPLALGSDTGGSVRTPAAFCGCVALKPAAGAVSTAGVVPLAPSLDTVGWITRTAADAELILDVLCPGEPVARPEGGLAGVRIGVLEHLFTSDRDATPATRAAIASALRVLAEAGAAVKELRTAPAQDFEDCGGALLAAEAYAIHGRRSAAYGPTARAALTAGKDLTAAQYAQARRRRRALRRELDALLRASGTDLLATATTLGPAWRFGDRRARATVGNGAVRIAFNVVGYAALALPVGFDDDGLPLSMQIAAPPGDERVLLHVARAYQQATRWHRVSP